MFATIETKALKSAIGSLTPAGFVRSCSLPVLFGVRITAEADGRIVLTRTDLDLTIEVELEGQVEVPGTIVVADAKAWKASLPTGGGSTILGVDGATFRSTSAGVVTSLSTAPLGEWPRTPAPIGEMVQVKVAPIASVLPAASRDQVRPILCSVLFDGHRVVATDSFRLHVADRSTAEPALKALIPEVALRLAVKAAGKATEMGLLIDDVQELAQVKGGNVTFTQWLTVGEFPRYERLFPTDPPFVLDLSTATEVVKAAIKAAVDGGAVRFKVEAGEVAVTSGPMVASIPLGGTTAPEGFYMGLNPRYLLAALAGTDGLVRLVDALEPVLIDTSHGQNLLMPVRVS